VTADFESRAAGGAAAKLAAGVAVSTKPSVSIHMPVLGSRLYVVWLLSRQFVNAASISPPGASALSDFTYDFGPLFFVFA
jgi:hypothetical protein